MAKTKSIRLTQTAIEKLYIMAGEIQAITGKYVSPSETIRRVYASFGSIKGDIAKVVIQP